MKVQMASIKKDINDSKIKTTPVKTLITNKN